MRTCAGSALGNGWREMDLRFASVCELSGWMAEGRLTSETLVGACLERIALRDGEVRAWAFLDPDRALDAARHRDREPRRGPLHGIPVGVKDVIDTGDMPTECGTPIHAGVRPAADAACVALLKGAGAVILGKTRTTELATFQPTVTRNPHDLSRTPGGSSSGSAAAVAEGMVPAALGTQTWGSVIRPAAYCGVVGIKPGFGTVPRAGLRLQSDSLDTVGGFCRSAADLPLLLAGMAGIDLDELSVAAPERPRIGICRGPGIGQAAAESLAALDAAAETLGAGGAELQEMPVPARFEEAWELQPRIALHEMARSYAAEWFAARDRLSARLRQGIEDGLRISRADHVAALAVAHEARAALARRFESFDALLTLAQPGEAPKGLDSTGDPAFNRLWTLVGAPSVTLPVMRGPEGMPVGVQIVGPPRDEGRLLALAANAERQLRKAFGRMIVAT